MMGMRLWRAKMARSSAEGQPTLFIWSTPGLRFLIRNENRALIAFKNILSPSTSESWKNLFRVKLQKTRLILPWSMKYQVSETKLNVWANLFHMLICIVRNKPSAICLVCNSCSLSFHLNRVMDIHLILGR